MNFTPVQLAELINGSWDETPAENRVISSAFFDRGWSTPSAAWVTTNRDQWPRKMDRWTEDYQILSRGIRKGVAAVIVRPGVKVPDGVPVLRVENTWDAMKTIAFAVRDESPGKRLLVTGTEGKTGFKVQLFHALKNQLSTFASIDSKNMSYPIISRMAMIPDNAELSIFEVAVPKRRVGKRRAAYVQPHVCVITELGYEHLHRHGSVEKLIRNKASVVSALSKDGVCIVKSDPKYFLDLKQQISRYGDFPVYTCGVSDQDNAQLLKAEFKSDPYGWQVMARVEDSTVMYFVPVLESHAAMSSLLVLLTVSVLGLDVNKAAQSFQEYQPYRTSGRFSRLRYKQGFLDFYDQSYRSYLLGYQDFFEVCSRIKPQQKGRKIVVLGMVFDEREYGARVWELLPVGKVQQWLVDAKIDQIHTIGEREQFEKVILHRQYWKTHPESVDEFIPVVLDHIDEGDLLMVKGDRNEKMFLLSEYLLKVTGH